MPRSRLLKPGFYKNEELAQCTPHARLCFAGLWLLADREGRLEDRPLRIKAELFPYEPLDLDAVLSELSERGFIQRYLVGNQRFMAVSKFSQHQHPHVNEAISTIPAPEQHQSSTIQAPQSNSASTLQDRLVLVLDPLTLNPIPCIDPETVPRAKEPRVAHPPPNGNVHDNGTARSKRPIFTGQRLTVFEWMLDDCTQILGPLTDAFDLHEWFFTLDAEAAKTSMVIPKRDSGAWLQAQLLAEAKRRNLPIASVQTKADAITAENVAAAKRVIASVTGRS